MPANRNAKIPSPAPLMRDFWMAGRTFVVAAALKLDVFSHIATGLRSADQVADAASAKPSAMRRLLDALVALKYLSRKGDQYSLTPVAATYLVRNSELYMEGADRVVLGLAADWAKLADSVRTGNPVASFGANGANLEEFFATLVKSIFPGSYVPARAAVAAIGTARCRTIERILDVGAGSGAWSLAFAEKIPKARVTAVDSPMVTRLTRQYAERFGVAARYEYLEGDLREVELGQGRYDLAILGHVIHGQGAELGRKLIERCAAALRPDGMLLIAEIIPNDQRTAPEGPLLFGLSMLLSTPAGDVYTMRDYRAWLKAAGFKAIKRIQAPSPSPLILASK
jgi:3-hydroxy-5-methyl-1-naphthoate 3-O-methyltransferase